MTDLPDDLDMLNDWNPAKAARELIRSRMQEDALTMWGDLMRATMADAATAAGRGEYVRALDLLSEVRVYLDTATRAVEGWKGESRTVEEMAE